VSQLNAQVKEYLQSRFGAVWVTGEITDLSRPQSGHVYLTLKDENAQVRAVIWRATAARLRFPLEDGMEVICQGEMDVYTVRGTYQLVIRRLEPRGVGALQRALERLRATLAAEGLFQAEHKKPLPAFPRRIAVVTSPTGAALRDFLEVVRQRWRGVHVLVIPARVQGAEAAAEIVAGIRTAHRLRPAPDVLVVTRGGGSLEDLWCFNEECVVRAIFQATVPVVSAIGHEIDVTLADLVADVRCLTPTDAAQRVVPAAEEIANRLGHLQRRLRGGLGARVDQCCARLRGLATRRVFTRPWDLVRQSARRVDDLESRLARAVRVRMSGAEQRTTALAARLESLSPLAVLARGYSLTLRRRDGQIVRTADQVTPGEEILTRLVDGQVTSRVETVDDQPKPA
jgi:exodeoxyribonuclease VII large subunit